MTNDKQLMQFLKNHCAAHNTTLEAIAVQMGLNKNWVRMATHYNKTGIRTDTLGVLLRGLDKAGIPLSAQNSIEIVTLIKNQSNR